MNLFETMSDTTKQVAEMIHNFQKAEMPGIDHTPTIASNDSGSYRFEPISKKKTTGAQYQPEPIPLEEESKSSLYNLLDHPWENLHLLGLAVLNYKLDLMNVKDKNPAMWEKICAWEKLINSAIKLRSERDSEAWAEQQVKEIKQSIK